MSWRPVWWISSIASAALWAGCTTAHMGEGRGQAANAAGSEAVTILLNYMGLEGRTVEEEIVGCIRDGIRKTHPALRIVPPDEFRHTAFPDLAPEAAPKSPEYLGMLLSDPVFRERIMPLNIRYLIAIGGDKQVKTSGGAVGFAASAPAAADLEGLRRVALMAAELRSHRIAAAAVPRKLEEAAARDPYDGEPFLWDEATSSILFIGIAPGDRGQHSILY